MIHFELAAKKQTIEQLEAKALEPDFWDNHQLAENLINRTNKLKDIVSNYSSLLLNLNNLADEINLLKNEYSLEMHELLTQEFNKVMKRLHEFEMETLLSGEYDSLNAIIEIHAGAGGTDAQDWADMLYRMYVRYGERHNFKMEILDYQVGEEAGIKSVSFVIRGNKAYGYLKSEKGVHRLVRISPFDASGKRHTSFASVDVMPELTDKNEIVIDDKDLRIDTYHSSGAGGQHVNKTDSAVRITHLPSGIVVSCQSQRSQIQNKEHAMNALRSKLYQKELLEKEAMLETIRGEHKAIEWGSQIRSYVFMPYLMVKDNRTGYETSDVSGIMDGNIDELIYAYLTLGVK